MADAPAASHETPPFERAVRLALAVLLVLSALALLLETGLWRRTETLTGPFATLSGRPSVLLVPLLTSHPGRALLDTGGDTPSTVAASTLRLRIGAEPISSSHTNHHVIGVSPTPAFSHWRDTLLLSLPRGTANDGAARIMVDYPLRLKPWLTSMLLALGVVLTLFTYRRRLTVDRIAFVRSMTTGALLLFGRTLLVLSAIYLLSAIVAYAGGAALPTTAVFKWSSGAVVAAQLETSVAYVILCLSTFNVGTAWLHQMHGGARPQRTTSEDALAHFYSRWGLVLLLALSVFSISAQWAGLLRPGDLAMSNLVGLLPFSDAGAYFMHASDGARDGVWSDFVGRRPMAGAFRASLALLADYNYGHMILLQAALVTVATFLAAAAIGRRHGVWAALGFAALMIIAARSFVPTSLTEPLGLFWALLAVPFVIQALHARSLGMALLALAIMTIALLTRMGAMFVVPALMLWMIITFGDTWRRRALVAGLALLTTGAVFGVNAVLKHVHTSASSEVGGNFAHVLCGLSIGTTWNGCLERYPTEIKQLPNEKAQAAFLNARAVAHIRANPLPFVSRIGAGTLKFLQDLPRRLLQGYMLVPVPLWFPTWPLFGFLAMAATASIVVQPARGEALFWTLLIGAITASAGIVYFDDGGRVLSASFPLLGYLLTRGLITPQKLASEDTSASSLPWVSVGLAAVAVLGLALLPSAAVQPPRAKLVEMAQAAAGRHTVHGGARLSGVLVVDDVTPQTRDVPTITLRQFERIVHLSGVELYQGLVTPVAPPLPFGIVAGLRTEAGASSGYWYIVPADVLRRRDVPRWRFTLADWQPQPDKPVFWYRVTHAEPAPP